LQEMPQGLRKGLEQEVSSLDIKQPLEAIPVNRRDLAGKGGAIPPDPHPVTRDRIARMLDPIGAENPASPHHMETIGDDDGGFPAALRHDRTSVERVFLGAVAAVFQRDSIGRDIFTNQNFAAGAGFAAALVFADAACAYDVRRESLV